MIITNIIINNLLKDKSNVLNKLINQEQVQDFIVMKKRNKKIHHLLGHCLMIAMDQESHKIIKIIPTCIKKLLRISDN